MRKNKLPVILEPEEAEKLLRQPNKRYPTGLRNKAMISLMLNCGLHISEVANLRPGNCQRNWLFTYKLEECTG